MIEFGGTVDQKTLQRALRIHSKALLWLGPLLIVVGAINFWQAKSWGPPLFVILFGAFLLITPWISARSQLKSNAMLRAPVKGTADEERVTFETEFGQSAVPWEKLHRARVRPDIVLLYPGANQMFAIPERYFASREQWEEFRQLVSRRVPQDRLK